MREGIPGKEEKEGSKSFLFNSEQIPQGEEVYKSSSESDNSETLYDKENSPFFHHRIKAYRGRKSESLILSEENVFERRHQSVMMEKLSVVSII